MSSKRLDENIDFASVMAVAVHDMKNSISLLMQSIEDLNHSIPECYHESREHLVNVHYEASRLNTSLVQLLAFYRSDMDALPTNIDECYIAELMQEIVDTNLSYSKQRKLSASIEIEDDLTWFVDRDLIFLLMHDVFINTIRYGADNIKIAAKIADQHLHLSIEDNGPGYPESMLLMSDAELDRLCLSEGRTGLGLFFAKLIAATHKNAGKSGFIKLSNNPDTGGSVFELILP